MNKRRCKGKRRYLERDAKKAAKAMSKKYDADIMAYDCNYCDWWHIGNRPTRHPVMKILDKLRKERNESRS